MRVSISVLRGLLVPACERLQYVCVACGCGGGCSSSSRRTAAKSYGHTNNTVSDRRVPPRAQTTAARQACIAHELHAREPMTHVPCDVPCDVLLTPLQARSSQPPPSSTVVIRDQSLKCHVLTYCSHLYRHSSQPPPSSTVVRRDQSLKCHDGESSRLSRYTRHQTSNREVNRPK